ncbi:MAG: FAD-dependent oxidoreductase [Dyadobacter sp. 50-39]|uniref:FAD-dependent monooxygenase n=1 Tax=Dyadobacter sp. 50-39 TaxID=1895756 RepID=UPI000959D797|nr:FAD-dependent monooxygenase [Dyadobacter sp. 50-39]OJV16967.1 MAG: FAD-dependent oxidoreductase [Dyadobacter sp. 50-39]
MKATTNQPSYDVIISGAGPVGLFLACELALGQCRVLVLEKEHNPESPLKRLPFGIRGLSSPTIEALLRRGLLEELEIHKRLKNPHVSAKPQQDAQRQVGHFAGIPLLEGNIDRSKWAYRLPGSPDTSLISEMAELETILTRRAETLGVAIRRGVRVTRVDQTGENVTVWSTDQPFEAKWIVGCDGSRSVVRKAGGFAFEGTEPEFTGYTTLIDIVDPEKLRPGRNVTSKGMYMQSQPGYVLIQDFDGGAFHNSGAAITREHIQAVLRRISGTDVTIRTRHTATTWTDRARQASQYRNGRILLAGDAAHIHSPLGGQGLNLGLGDVMNLGWKLAAVIRKQAPEALLDTYHAERHPIGAQVLDWSRAQVAIMRPDPQARALRTIVQDLIDTGDGATYIAGRVWGMYTRYDLGGHHPLTGRSVPDFQLADGTKIAALMHDGQMILLDFEENPSLRALANAYARRIKYVSGKAKDRLGLDALLIRPDGIVAWASGGAAASGDLTEILNRYWDVTED